MKQMRTVVTRKGQVTVPAEIRRALGLSRGDVLAFEIDQGGVRLVRADSVVERTAGALKSDGPPLTAEQLRDAAEIAIAAEADSRFED